MEPEGIALRMTAYPRENSGELAAFERIMSQCERRVLRVALRLLNRSEEHTSELQSLRHLVCRLLLEKYSCFFSFTDTATTEIYSLSLHDALPILAPFERIMSQCERRVLRVALRLLN